MPKTVACVIGRFQPYHRGHHSALEKALKRFDEVVVGIGSTQYAGTRENPLSGAERKEIIEACAAASGFLERVSIAYVADIHDEKNWARHALKLLPRFDVLLTNNALVRKLFEREDVRVEEMPSAFPDVTASAIREAAAAGRPWKARVPRPCLEKLQAMKFVERVKKPV